MGFTNHTDQFPVGPSGLSGGHYNNNYMQSANFNVNSNVAGHEEMMLGEGGNIAD